MAEGASLIEKYKGAESDAPGASAEHHLKVLDFKPEWERYEATRTYANLLKHIEPDAPAVKTKAILQGNLSTLQALLDALQMQDDKPVQWILAFLYDLLREDSSCYALFEEAAKSQINVYKPLMMVLGRSRLDSYIADKVVWLLSAIMGNVPRLFSDEQVKGLVAKLLETSDPKCTELGVLDAICNLLKADSYRSLVWSIPGVSDRIFRIMPRSSPSPCLYKCVFAIWMLTFDPEITADLKNLHVIKKIRDILTFSRVEKVARLCLTVLRNMLSHKALCEEIVEEGLLEAVQQLEFEKWRDPDLYEDIRDMSSLISTEVQALSNYDRYERELSSGSLQWGFIHSSKFWSENVMKFEQNDFRALKMLAGLLQSDATDATTLAVACHDVGEFVALHPLGKKKVAQLNVKERVMQLMGSTEPQHREVRREALLCCQKIMLNKWQDMEAPPK